jgi:hypothetical protein
MSRDPITGIFTRPINSFSDPVLGEVIDPNDATLTFNGFDAGITDSTAPPKDGLGATDNAVTRFDGTTGIFLQNSLVTVDDSGNIATPGTITATGTIVSPTISDLPASLAQFNVKPANSGATNTANMVAALASGRPLVAGPGTYNFSGNMTLVAATTLSGAGTESTLFNFASSTGIVAGSFTLQLSDMMITTGGVGVTIGTTLVANFFSIVQNVYFHVCPTGIDVHNGSIVRILDCDFDGYTSAGIGITAELNADAGDSLIDGCWFLTNGGVGGGASNAAVFLSSGGGWKTANCKMVGGNRGVWYRANYTGASSSLIITGNSIEGMAQQCIALTNASATLGDFYNLAISTCQMGSSGGTAILIDSSGTRQWVHVAEINNIVSRNDAGLATINADGVDGLNISGGSYGDSGAGTTTAVIIGSHCTNGTVYLPTITNHTNRFTNASATVNVVNLAGNLAVTAAKTVSITNSLTIAGTDGSTVNVGAGGTIQPIAYNPLTFAAPITNSLAGDVTLNNIANYFAGPVVAQGSVGTWFVSGTVTVLDTAGAATFFAKLWDGTTVIASGAYSTAGASFNGSFSLSGFITSPAGNLRIDVRDIGATTGLIKANQTGNAKDSTITAYRIG